jgi:hypothetical protein
MKQNGAEHRARFRLTEKHLPREFRRGRCRGPRVAYDLITISNVCDAAQRGSTRRTNPIPTLLHE